MKQTAKRILAFVMVVCMAFLGVIVTPFISASAATSYEETAFGEGTFLITTTFNGSTYYLPAATTSSGPIATAFTDVDSISQDHLWTVTSAGTEGQYYIQNSSGSYLYTTNDNNGVRVGKTQNAWAYDSGANSFKDMSTNRYLGIYNASNWRCYTAVDQGNYKESSTSFKFYKVNAAAPSVSITTEQNNVQVGETLALEADIQNIDNPTVAWTSDNTDVATVNAETGVVTAVAMGKAKITAAVGKVTAEKEITVWPVAESELTIAEAIKVCELTGTTNAPYVYSATGNVESIDEDNTAIITDGTNDLKAYKMAAGEALQEGDNITVTGNLCMFGTTPEFNEGATYVKNEIDDGLADIKAVLNDVNAYMSLAFKYTEVNETVPVESTVVDKLTRDSTGVTAGSSTYKDWTFNGEKAAYKGQSAGTNDAIQLRSKNNNSGIVTTVSGGKVKKIIVKWATVSSGRQLDVYASNTAYTAATDLYDNNTAGTKLGSIASGVETEFLISGDYQYIGLKSADGAIYLASVEITWDTGATGTTTETSYKDVDFRVRCGVDASLADIEGIDGYGIQVSINEKSVNYNVDNATSWEKDEVNGKYFVMIALGDLFANPSRFNAEITVRAFVVVDGITYYAETVTEDNNKTYSVADMVATYYNTGLDEVKEKVEHLYNYLFNVEEE